MNGDVRQRLAVLHVSQVHMERILRLPEGYEIVHSHPVPHRDATGFLLRSPAFDVQPYGVELPECQVVMTGCPTCRGPVFEEVIYPHDPLSSTVYDLTYSDRPRVLGSDERDAR